MEIVRDRRRKGGTAERGGGPATRKDDDGAPAHGGNSNGGNGVVGPIAPQRGVRFDEFRRRDGEMSSGDKVTGSADIETPQGVTAEEHLDLPTEQEEPTLDVATKHESLWQEETQP
ncbi:hypothetical protein Scep_007107 [Stephania cephalantha]|uniref:Uncharacterized protein n=1 Tax=Stephania cephalantha TaxID=152367 RepID=A0AAP0KBX5_9MAGN